MPTLSADNYTGIFKAVNAIYGLCINRIVKQSVIKHKETPDMV